MTEENLLSSTSENSSQFNSTSRNENTLYELTQFILQQLSEKHPNPVEISDLTKKFGIAKRTVYYVTNVMMGLGFVQKSGVGKISWCSSNISNYLNEPDIIKKENIDALKKRKEELIKEIKLEDIMMQEMGKSIENIRESYVIKKDIINLKSVKGKVCFLVKTPERTYMDVSIEPPNFYLELTSKEGKVEAFFIEDDN